MIVLWSFSLYRHTHTSDHIVESTALPDNLVRNAGGQVAFEESAIRVNDNSLTIMNQCVSRLLQLVIFPITRSTLPLKA